MTRDRRAAVKGATVLAVDDQPENLELVEEILSGEGYRVVFARDGEEALAAVAEHEPDCVVLDIMMPRLDGFQVCARLKSDARTQFVPIVMLTALSGVSEKVKALEAGADDFLNKPVRSEELRARVGSLVRIKRTRDERDSSESIIFTMVRALESRDPRGAGHCERVAAASMAVARRLGLSGPEREAVVKGALLHDVGKVGVPEEVLLARGPLTVEQEAQMRQHAVIGEKILRPLRSLQSARDVVRHHHERVDGSGYPDALLGRELSLPAQIVGLANAYEGLVHEDGLSPGSAAERLEEEVARGRFARDLAAAFLETGAAVVGSPGDSTPDAWSELAPSGEVAPTGTVLVADDTPSNLEVLVETLGEAGFSVVSVDSGDALLVALRQTEVDLVLLDVRMPALDGFEVCARIKDDPETEFLPVVLVTADHDSTERARGLECGADDFLAMPLDRLELLARVRSLLRLRRYHRDVEDHQSVVLSLASIIEAKDPYTTGHSARVGDLASRLAAELGLPASECELMRLAGLLHDIGKVGVPGWIMNKPGRLTPAEFERVMSHPTEGEMLCRPLKTIQAVLPIIRHHHERFDGGGFPDHLRGEAIPSGARLLALCDAFDALTSERAYRTRLSSEEALAVLDSECDRGRWDPVMFEALSAMIRR